VSSAEKKADPAKAEKPKAKTKLSDSVLAGGMKFAGMARTTNGFCVAEVEISADGKLVSLTLDASERYPQFVAARAKQRQLKLALEVQRNAGNPKSALGVQKLNTQEGKRNWGAF
jgi:hypothetical protein